jgi:superfamily II DNA or RNA helicase
VETPYTLAPLTDAKGLLSYQLDPARFLTASLRSFNAGLDASDTGVGKTYTSLAAFRELGLRPLVVAPLITIPGWLRAAKHLGVEIDIVGWEKVRCGRTEFGKWGGDDKKTFIWAPSVKALIFDEAHRAKSHKTQSHRLVTAAKSQGIPALALSATLAENPLDLKAVGYLLGLHQLRNFWAWTRSYGCKPSPFGGFEFVGPDKPGILKRLHGEIFPRKGARLKKSALADFPETSIHTSLCPVADADEINQAYADIEAALDTVAERELTDKEHHLTVRLRARQKIELQKLPYIIDRTQDLVADGNSVCIFLNFSDSIKTVADALRAENVEVSVVEGGQTAEERERNIEAFQSDRVRVIIVNIQAGGVGVSLHDLNGQFPRHSLISPNDSARLIIQVFGRVHRAGGKTKSTQELLFAAGTVEEAIAARCEEKIVRIDAFNDGDLRQAA